MAECVDNRPNLHMSKRVDGMIPEVRTPEIALKVDVKLEEAIQDCQESLGTSNSPQYDRKMMLFAGEKPEFVWRRWSN